MSHSQMAGSTLRQPLPYTGGTAPGCREKATGVPIDVGNAGFSNSSSVSNDNGGVCLGFTMTYFYSSNTGSRGNGLPLRCLSE
ncbi:hypothetical protein [uncultured Rikenella sp.]|uniref:hypothetical protein n=1 Tax=uncultured Rikenella sp. TaxID=368003 RepID=UPI0026331B93|nr:hypothetical protein [uncultured Rikenella sp.]